MTRIPHNPQDPQGLARQVTQLAERLRKLETGATLTRPDPRFVTVNVTSLPYKAYFTGISGQTSRSPSIADVTLPTPAGGAANQVWLKTWNKLAISLGSVSLPVSRLVRVYADKREVLVRTPDNGEIEVAMPPSLLYVARGAIVNYSVYVTDASQQDKFSPRMPVYNTAFEFDLVYLGDQ